ncbi:ribonuclease iii [Leptolyngbya sp. Heron Island J]|uniref:ribonuclease III domain-containing protein n=1 Tax=Leptolyngbya sp. Heron Island J TaxID=1385935 RepID=UPI0003B9863E|nr:ribonuclease III domain-containing protein [Leptolyngbya sp. Heron Island J]ESA35840.1 ribonuclease iii [Leptolyngbya sp. Heron Island J]
MTPNEIQNTELRLGYIFTNKDLLIQSLTRTAAANEQRQSGQICEDQEILCTLGDAVLKLVLVDLLMKHGYTTPGDITQHKEKLEKGTSLGPMLREIGIAPIVGRGEQKLGIQDKSDALAETFEAIIGAIYQDGGYGIIKKLVAKWFRPKIEALQSDNT